MQGSAHIANFGPLKATFLSTEFNVLTIPAYQRPYSWEKQHVEDLFKDVAALAIRDCDSDDNIFHHIGSIMIKKNPAAQKEKGHVFIPDENEMLQYTRTQSAVPYDIVDGQQRLTTIWLFAGVLYRIMKTGRDNRRDHIFYHPTKTAGRLYPKLRLVHVDNAVFRRLLAVDYVWSDESNLSTTTRLSAKRLIAAEKVLARCVDNFSIRVGKSLVIAASMLWDTLLNRVTCIKFDVPPEMETIGMFESLNSRGKELTCLQMTRSWLNFLTERHAAETEKPELYKLIGEAWEFVWHVCEFNGSSDDKDEQNIFDVAFRILRGGRKEPRKQADPLLHFKTLKVSFLADRDDADGDVILKVKAFINVIKASAFAYGSARDMDTCSFAFSFSSPYEGLERDPDGNVVVEGTRRFVVAAQLESLRFALARCYCAARGLSKPAVFIENLSAILTALILSPAVVADQAVRAHVIELALWWIERHMVRAHIAVAAVAKESVKWDTLIADACNAFTTDTADGVYAVLEGLMKRTTVAYPSGSVSKEIGKNILKRNKREATAENRAELILQDKGELAKNFVKYLLMSYSYFNLQQPVSLDNQKSLMTAFKKAHDTLEIEHIRPRRPGGSDWPDFSSDNSLHKFGNLTLLHPKMNKKLNEKPWDIKKKAYQESSNSNSNNKWLFLNTNRHAGVVHYEKKYNNAMHWTGDSVAARTLAIASFVDDHYKTDGPARSKKMASRPDERADCADSAADYSFFVGKVVPTAADPEWDDEEVPVDDALEAATKKKLSVAARAARKKKRGKQKRGRAGDAESAAQKGKKRKPSSSEAGEEEAGVDVGDAVAIVGTTAAGGGAPSAAKKAKVVAPGGGGGGGGGSTKSSKKPMTKAVPTKATTKTTKAAGTAAGAVAKKKKSSDAAPAAAASALLPCCAIVNGRVRDDGRLQMLKGFVARTGQACIGCRLLLTNKQRREAYARKKKK